MNLSEYLAPVAEIIASQEQREWFERLEARARTGFSLYQEAENAEKNRIWRAFQNRVRTEEIKAWYSEPDGESLFQGTSVSSLTIPYVTSQPLKIDSIEFLEEIIAQEYIYYHDKHADQVRGAIQENTDYWISQGLYYGVVLCSKVLSQAFGLSISAEDVIFEVDGYLVDPHEITSCPKEIRENYFKKCQNRIDCFHGLDLERRELEASLALADISKPKIKEYKGKILLGPIRCNEIAAILSRRVIEKIVTKSSGRIRPRSLAVVIYDTDTPYTYHQIMGYSQQQLAPTLPGLVVLGASGTIDAYRWLYSYRVSLITQKIQKGSLYSEVQKKFMPFVFFGVLVWRDAEILLDMEKLSFLRYRGNLCPALEFSYLLPTLHEKDSSEVAEFAWDTFRNQHNL